MGKLDDLNLFDPGNLIDPYDAYQTLRDQAPVYRLEGLNIHYVTRYDLVREAIKDTTTFSSQVDEFMAMTRETGLAGASEDVRAKLAETERKLIPQPPTMLTLDQPDHTKYRSLVSKLFTGSEVKRSEDQVRAVVERCADACATERKIDFMQSFAFPVPLIIIADRLGIPEEDRAFFDEAATAAAAGLRMSPLTDEILLRRAELALGLQDLLVGLIEARRADPRPDMISILANSVLEGDDRPLTHGEALSILQQFLVAGHETTASTFGWGMLILCRSPELQDQLRESPDKVRTFVEEVLRIESPVQGLARRVTRDTELGGYPLKAGEFIMLRYGAANRDERQFEAPETVNLDRKKAGMQLAFGSGVHHCIGAPLARQELNLGFPALLSRMQNIRIADGHSEPMAEPSIILRNLPELHIEFDPI